MLVNMNEMLHKAKEGHYAVPHFNINNLEWAQYILETCEQEQSPVILGVSEGAAQYMGGFTTVVKMIQGLLYDLKITIPVSLHLDHGHSVSVCKEACDAGFTSVMIDASRCPLPENIERTKEVVMYAKAKNISVEAEIGHIGEGTVQEEGYAVVEECAVFVKETGVDALAPALGSAHGLYKGTPHLDFNRMLEIQKETDLPLVLHGGTGIPDSLLTKAISCGICKININTELQVAWSKAVRLYIENHKDVYDPRKIIASGKNAIKEVIVQKINLLKSKQEQ